MNKKICSISLFSILFIYHLFGLNFKTFKLISIPGENKNYDVLPSNPEDYYKNYICWQNRLDSVYSIYLKKIDTTLTEKTLVYKDTSPNINPQIAINRYSKGIKILWQSRVNNHWQLLMRNVNDDSLGKVINVTDSLQNYVSPSLNNNRVVFINEGKLLIKSFYPEYIGYSEPIVIDSVGCSNPFIYPDDHKNFVSVIYEKGNRDNKSIYKAEYSYDIDGYLWQISKISMRGENNLNPKFAFGHPTFFSFQSYIDGNWKFDVFSYGYNQVSDNFNCNYYNPYYFTYPIPTGSENRFTPYFIAFDSDSLNNNHEIYIKTVNTPNDTIINISESQGYDEKPFATVFADSVTILWEHTENGNTEIWWAKNKFSRPEGIIYEQISTLPNFFNLNGNYPNPFNPLTKIKFEIRNKISDKVTIKIYNILGELVTSISKSIHRTGTYSVLWEGKSRTGETQSAGVYIYKIEYGDNFKTGKMCILK